MWLHDGKQLISTLCVTIGFLRENRVHIGLKYMKSGISLWIYLSGCFTSHSFNILGKQNIFAK